MTVLKWKWPIAGLILLVACVACLFALQQGDMVAVPFFVKVEAGGECETIVPWINEDGTMYVFFPAYADTSKSTFQMKTTGEVYIQGVRLVDQMDCGSFQLDVPYEMTFSSWGNVHQCRIVFVQSAKVATMYIDTESGSMEYIHAKKGNEEAGEMRLYMADGSLSYAGEISDINGRGNNTWEAFEKKPYSVNLKEEADLLGMGAAAKWILLANADDPSHMRNKMVFDFADEIGLAYSPDADWVDLYLNGEYAGLYLLSERNEIHSSRINVSEENSILLSMERKDRIDQREYPHIKTTEDSFALRLHYPLQVTSEKMQWIQSIWDAVEREIAYGIQEEVPQVATIDMESWAKKYLVEELFGNIDGCMNSQFFYIINVMDNWKVYAGPVWDYDHSMGSGGTWQFGTPIAFLSNTKERGGNSETPWLHNLYKNRDFYDLMVNIYQNEIIEKMATLIKSKMYVHLGEIKISAYLNQIRWGIEDNCKNAVERIRSYLITRNNFLFDAWVDNTQYIQVKADDGSGSFLGYFAVEVGEGLTDIPVPNNNAYQTFLGWYYEGTDEPFDPSRPIYEDTAVYAKWEDTPYKRISQVKKLLPAGVIAIMFLAILAADVRRMRKGG